jgi:hypothetical protein
MSSNAQMNQQHKELLDKAKNSFQISPMKSQYQGQGGQGKKMSEIHVL